MAYTNALYYPWIDIENEAWLKTSILFWERIHTIVPESIDTPYHSRTAMQLEDAGILAPVRIHRDMDVIKNVADDALRYIESDDAANVLLMSGNRGLRFRTPPRRDLSSAVHDKIAMHPEKFPYQVEQALFDTRRMYTRRSKSNLNKERNSWIYVDRPFASFYMTLLATRLADQLGFGLLTDSDTSHQLSSTARADSGFGKPSFPENDFSGYQRNNEDAKRLAQGLLVDMILEQIGVDPTTSVDAIIEFRNTHRSEIGRFRTAIEDLTTDVPRVQSLGPLRQYVYDKYQNVVAPAVSDLKEALQSNQIRWITEGCLKVSFLSLGSSSALALLGMAVPNALLAGATISLVATGVLYNQSKRETLRKNPYSYILSIERGIF